MSLGSMRDGKTMNPVLLEEADMVGVDLDAVEDLLGDLEAEARHLRTLVRQETQPVNIVLSCVVYPSQLTGKMCFNFGRC